jgi:hypothetical protein
MLKPSNRHVVLPLPKLLPCASDVGELVALILCQLLDLLHIVGCQIIDRLLQVCGAVLRQVTILLQLADLKGAMPLYVSNADERRLVCSR